MNQSHPHQKINAIPDLAPALMDRKKPKQLKAEPKIIHL